MNKLFVTGKQDKSPVILGINEWTSIDIGRLMKQIEDEFMSGEFLPCAECGQPVLSSHIRQ